MDSTFIDFLEVEAGGSGPPEPPKTNPTCTNPPSPKPNFNFLATTAANRPWLVVDVIAVPGMQHPLPKHLEKLLAKFDPNNDVTLEDHIKQFMLSLRLMDVQDEDVVFRLFPYTFVAQASTWFFNLAAGFIASWKQFETTFLSQFGDDRTSGVIVLELSRIIFDKKEKFKYFNQIFINLLNHVLEKPTESIQVEFYTTTFPPYIAMFVKARKKRNLAENLLEAIKVEKDMASISSHQGNEENKPSSLEKNRKKSKGILRMNTEKKDKEPMDMESMQRVIKKLTNDIIDLNKNKGEGKKPFKPFNKGQIMLLKSLQFW
jgi:hypothetical protein